ncbi:MAG: hypothetical protein OXC08_18815 [Thiotrichales bacterium]|nr:hypothetical protein [Thiotrichales bacterium]
MSDKSELRRLHGIPLYKMFDAGKVHFPKPAFTPEMLNAMRERGDPIRELRKQTQDYIRRTVRMYAVAGFSNVRVETAEWPAYGLKVVGELPQETLDLFQQELNDENDERK